MRNFLRKGIVMKAFIVLTESNLWDDGVMGDVLSNADHDHKNVKVIELQTPCRIEANKLRSHYGDKVDKVEVLVDKSNAKIFERWSHGFPQDTEKYPKAEERITSTEYLDRMNAYWKNISPVPEDWCGRCGRAMGDNGECLCDKEMDDDTDN